MAHADLLIGGTGNITISEEGGTFDANNLAPGGTAFAFDLIGGGALIPTHDIPNLNDATFGNSNSWIGNSPNSFCGISLGATTTSISSVAFGRDNLGIFSDRYLGLYTLQYTQAPNPDATTADTGVAATGWEEIGTLDYGVPVPGTIYSNPALRHRYNFDADDATGFRVITAVSGTCIDEIELYAPPPPLTITRPESFRTRRLARSYSHSQIARCPWYKARPSGSPLCAM